MQNQDTGLWEYFGESETGTFSTQNKGNDQPQYEIRPDDEKLVVTIPELIFLII